MRGKASRIALFILLTNFIPIFPLAIVVYPGEALNLHVFEPRYKQLINECIREGKMFGIPSVIEDRVNEMGTLVRIVELSQLYEDGKMDIRTEGVGVFKMLEIVKEIPEKLYSGAIVNYPENDMAGDPVLMKMLIQGMKTIHAKAGVEKSFPKAEEEMKSYDIAHHVGLSPEEEYRVVELLQERQRQEFLKRHIARVIPVMEEMEALRRKIRMNGHFRNLEGFKFN